MAPIAWAEHVVPARSGAAWRVPSGGFLRVTDLEGGQSGDVFFVDSDDVTDGLSNGRTFDYNGTIRPTVGSQLYSTGSRVLATIEADDVGRHDFLYAPCSQRMFEIEHGVTEPHPNCFDNLTGALATFGVPASTVTTAFNVFMDVLIGEDGQLTIRPPASHAGDSIVFRAERPVIVAVAPCSAELCNAGAQGPFGVAIGTEEVTPADG